MGAALVRNLPSQPLMSRRMRSFGTHRIFWLQSVRGRWNWRERRRRVNPGQSWFAPAVLLLFVVAGSLWFYRGLSNRRWAREEAVPQITDLFASRKPLAAFNLLEKAQSYSPSDPALKQISDQNTIISSITSAPSGATVRDSGLPHAGFSVAQLWSDAGQRCSDSERATSAGRSRSRDLESWL